MVAFTDPDGFSSLLSRGSEGAALLAEQRSLVLWFFDLLMELNKKVSCRTMTKKLNDSRGLRQSYL